MVFILIIRNSIIIKLSSIKMKSLLPNFTVVRV